MAIVPSPWIYPLSTKKFSVYTYDDVKKRHPPLKYSIKSIWESAYTETLVNQTLQRRDWCEGVSDTKGDFTVQIGDFEHIEWEPVVAGEQGASSFLVRKGLSRKAQLSLQMKRYISKHQESILKKAIPETYIVETWNAFDEVKIDFGFGVMTNFDMPTLQQTPLRQRLEWVLQEIKVLFPQIDSDDEEDSILAKLETHKVQHWILKPSVINKGLNIVVIQTWSELLDVLEEEENIREWVLQRYIANPLLLPLPSPYATMKQPMTQHKFHIRTYVLCVGALRVFTYDEMLLLFAAHPFTLHDTKNIFAHLTNTARASEDILFDEAVYVQLLHDLPRLLTYSPSYRNKHYPNLTYDQAQQEILPQIKSQIHTIIHDLFAAYENEYSIFCPMSNCFEIYGLDFLIDDDWNVSLLETNPGPDFKQTGDRLKTSIANLWEETFRIVIDSNLLAPKQEPSITHEEYDRIYQSYWKSVAPDFSLVYSKEWSVSSIKSGMSFS